MKNSTDTIQKPVNGIRKAINTPFLLILLCVCIINLPYFVPSFQFLPAHDTMAYAANFFFMYNEYVMNGEFPLWLPYNLYGSPSDYDLLYTMSPALYCTAFIGRLLSVSDALFLFKIGIVLEQLILLIGAYLLSKRLFTHSVSVILVTVGCLATSFWAVQLYWNFRIYYFIPLIVFYILKGYDASDLNYLLIAGNLTILSLIGNVTYYAPLWLLVYGVFTGVLFFRSPERLLPAKKMWFRLSTLLLFGGFLMLFLSFLHYMNAAFPYTMFYTEGRDYLTRKSLLASFLSYGGATTLDGVLEMVYGVQVTHDESFYIGFIPLTFLIYALMKSSLERPLKAILAAIAGILLLSISSVSVIAPLLYTYFPGMAYFRHIGLTRVVAKILLLFVAGWGLNTYLENHRQDDSAGGCLYRIGIGIILGVLLLDIFASKGLTLYMSRAGEYLKNPLFFQFHYLGMGMLVVALGLLYRADTMKKPLKSAGIIVCFLIEILSYHYWLYFTSPVILPEINKQQYETAADYGKKLEKLSESFLLLPYQFQEARAMPEQVAMQCSQRIPLTMIAWGAKYSTLYSAAYVDPCFQEYRIDYLPLAIDRFVRARMGLPLDIPLIQGIPSPNELSSDPVFLRALGCGSPKIFLTTQAHIAANRDEAASLIRSSQDLDTVPVLYSEKGRQLASIQQPSIKPNSIGRVVVKEFTANFLRVQAEVTAPNGAWLVYLDAYHPEWTVTVNGQTQEIVTANLAFKAVRLNPGVNDLDFTFRKQSWIRWYIHLYLYAGILGGCMVVGMLGYLIMPSAWKSLWHIIRTR